MSNGETEILTTGNNQILIKQFNKQKIKNGTKFEVRVQAIYGEWKSEYSEQVSVIPKTTQAPDAPENITIEGGYRLLNLSWKAMDDTDSYELYSTIEDKYVECSRDAINCVSDGDSLVLKISGLKVNTTYEIYLQGVNEIGKSKNSQLMVGTTTELEYAKTSNYKLINVPTDGDLTAHIESVEYKSGAASNPYAIVDNDYGTDWILNSWTSGGYNGNQIGPIVTFDDFYKMDRIIMVESSKQTYDYFYSRLQYWDEDGNTHVTSMKPNVKYDVAGKRYYEYNLEQPITTNKVQISLSNYLAYGDGMISIAELKFYHYDPLEADIYELFEDSTHVTLKKDVAMEDIEKLEQRLEEVDEVSGEYHYKKGILEIELNHAKSLLNETSLRESIQLDTTVTKAKDGHTGFLSGLNAWQPLGITAHEGEELIVYVGKSGAKVGENSNVKLIATQYHSESGNWYREVVTNLKVGRNEVRIPRISSMAVEHGGALYVEYTGNNDKDAIEVRVSGGTQIPVLDLSNITDENEKKKAIEKYLVTLTNYVSDLEKNHMEDHYTHEETNCDYEYDPKNCILNTTDIVLDKMMYSVAAEQVLAGIRLEAESDQLSEQVDVLYRTLAAMDQAMDLFYQHKGFVEYPTDAEEYKKFVEMYGDRNKMPATRLNIRYSRMFAGAFMYAGGLHIGIEWDSVPELMNSNPVITDENGKYLSGKLFGWGIGHEIGHTINQKDYEVTEITNNYFAQLLTSKDNNETARFDYKDVYEKVTSGTIGASDNGAVNLAMYWQLHLAYDNGYNFKTYDTYEEQLYNLLKLRT